MTISHLPVLSNLMIFVDQLALGKADPDYPNIPLVYDINGEPLHRVRDSIAFQKLGVISTPHDVADDAPDESVNDDAHNVDNPPRGTNHSQHTQRSVRATSQHPNRLNHPRGRPITLVLPHPDDDDFHEYFPPGSPRDPLRPWSRPPNRLPTAPSTRPTAPPASRHSPPCNPQRVSNHREEPTRQRSVTSSTRPTTSPAHRDSPPPRNPQRVSNHREEPTRQRSVPLSTRPTTAPAQHDSPLRIAKRGYDRREETTLLSPVAIRETKRQRVANGNHAERYLPRAGNEDYDRYSNADAWLPSPQHSTTNRRPESSHSRPENSHSRPESSHSRLESSHSRPESSHRSTVYAQSVHRNTSHTRPSSKPEVGPSRPTRPTNDNSRQPSGSRHRHDRDPQEYIMEESADDDMEYEGYNDADFSREFPDYNSGTWDP